MEFDLQRHLEQMEDRIREDIRQVGETARMDSALARATADAAVLANQLQDGRLKNLEEKAGWVTAGFGATFIGLVGFLWHVITGHRP